MRFYIVLCMRATQDNVIVRLIPLPEVSQAGIFFIPPPKRSRLGCREAEVLAVGPGHYRDSGFGAFIPTTVQVGQIVLIDETPDQDYRLDRYVPRQNKGAWKDDLRIVREDEIHAVVETVEESV